MIKFFLIFFSQNLIFFCLYFISLHTSFFFCVSSNILYFNFTLNYINIWFVFFMAVIFYILIFFLSRNIISYSKTLYIYFMFFFIFLSVSFLSLTNDFIIFIVLYESLFFPICFISLFFNFNNSFIFAIFYFIIFSSISSILCIIICIIIIFHFNTLNLHIFTDIFLSDSIFLIIFIWSLLFLIFSINYPIWPFHIWLPELHVEVNTEISVLLASIVLNVGFFGIYNFLFICMNNISIWFIGIIDCIIMLGLIFISVSLLFLIDYNNIIANWSVIHTCISIILLWHNDLLFIHLIILCNMTHIISSSIMFIMIGHIYDNYGISIFLILSSFFGISVWSSLFLALFLFNIDFPFMLLFYIDIFILYGLISLSFFYIFCFYIIVLTLFISSIFIYICLSYYSFLWIDNYIRLDLSINDIYIFFSLSSMCLSFFFFIYLMF